MKPLFLFLLAVALYSCSSNQSAELSNWQDLVTFQKAEDVIFQIDAKTSRHFNPISYSDKLDLLGLFNNNNHTLYLFDLKSQKEVSKLKLTKDGPDNIPTVDALIIHSKDSIITLNRNLATVTIFNLEGVILYKSKILEADEPGFPLKSQFSYKDGKIYSTIKGYLKTRRSLKNKTLMTYNLKDSTKQFLVETPERLEFGWADRNPMRDGILIPSESKYVFSYSMDRSIFSMGLDSKEVQSKTYNSHRLRATREYNGDNNNKESIIRYQLTNTWNESLFFYKEEGIILRSASVGKHIPKNSPLNGQYRSQNKDSIYVVTEIFDKNLKKVGEVPSMVFYNDIFSSPKGLYVTNYGYDQNNEDIIVFSRFTIKNIQDRKQNQ